MSYKVRLRSFEGPFDLLVYLIENAQMNIYDIQISEITSQYLEYLQMMRDASIEISSEFMVLAAELVEIKSRMMLPRPETNGDIIGVEDPRSELAERLLAYKRCKEQSEMLSERWDQMLGVMEKPQEDISIYLDNPDELLALNIDEFAKAFNMFLHRKRKIEETRQHYSKVERERETIENRMNFIRDTMVRSFKAGDEEVSFRELVPSINDRYDIAVSFSSLLQMMRDRYLNAKQEVTYGDIRVIQGERGFEEASFIEEDAYEDARHVGAVTMEDYEIEEEDPNDQ